MAYPKSDLRRLAERVELYAQLMHEYGAKGVERIVKGAEKALAASAAKLTKLPVDKKLAAKEPSDYAGILRLRPAGPRRLWQRFDRELYRDRLEGAMLARFAGCTLGAPVEGWSIDGMERLARENGEPFPPTDYWSRVPDPDALRYDVSPRRAYTREHMDGVPVDDDIAYTLLGLLIMEDYGPDFTVDDVGKAWLKYLPCACTAEEVALRNLKAGARARKAAEKDNPFCEWIGADIRSDPWGYLAPGLPERAAGFAWRDAYLSHRRNGIFGEMFFSAAISAAFAVKHPLEAVEIALTEIPSDCSTAQAVRWALSEASKIRNYREARKAVDERFPGMHGVHTINNACLTIFGLAIGGTDVTRVIGETVAMGLDNDCTAATAGSIVGAVVGKGGVPARWYARFNGRVVSYLIGHKEFSIPDLVERFARGAERVFSTK